MVRLAGLDLLRILAGLGLIVCHAGFLLSSLQLPDSVWLYLGLAGVEVFLVCLGFLLTCQLLADAPVRIGWQWMRALVRLWPLYALMLALNLFLSPQEVSDIPWLRYLLLIQNLAWPHPDFFGEAWIVPAAAMVALLIPVLLWLIAGRAFATGLAGIMGMLLLGCLVRGLLVKAGDPAFDPGVRKVLLMRLDLPFYGVLAGWLWTHCRIGLLRWRNELALLGMIALGATAYLHGSTALDDSGLARNALLPLCDIGCALLLPWACAFKTDPRTGKILGVAAASMYAGLLTHVTTLRIGVKLGLPLATQPLAQGLLWLSACILFCSGVAVLVWWLLDRPWLQLRDRLLPEHARPIQER